ncbi:uncharacterized protein SPPG_04237 [Spizellomyces punctatus DAOM BR117]|uniref:ATP synthase subunit 4 n=1 Tax=Spizellomyces punctatus (strain DAOM BR117) TaxID=645134 RepID=A0A0L0HJT7_SPIPD|nr:uncharacterized protein SPPG_04237 [Spizellomyces punctatus DAOM BR117]KND01145.1 hypothetical protein SPPG_04237 [Spizellomyces punctatus DAOM BR117]|eukprot:XP_016609184.1 hypothetical protein SPPG_04237 [Spizellomyces punctatus DAOM BR117]
MAFRSFFIRSATQLSRNTAAARIPQFATAKCLPWRLQHTHTVGTEHPDPKLEARSLIELFPGDNLAAKSSSVLVAASMAAYLISKEIYIIDAEVFEMVCIFGAYWLWYRGGKEGVLEYFKEKKATIKNVLESARADHKAVVQERVNHISKMSDIVNVTDALFDMSKEMVVLVEQAYELQQKVALYRQVKGVLDAWVRHEVDVRERLQKQLTSTIISRVREILADEKMQREVLRESLAQLERLVSGTKPVP